MKDNNLVVLVLCLPILNLYEKYPSVVMKPQMKEIPLGLLYLAGELEKNGFQVIIKDNTIEQLSNEKLAIELAGLNPLLIGFSILAFNVRSSRDVARLVKKYNPGIPVVFGGPHATLMPLEQANYNFVDVVITGMGEISLVKIAKKIRDGSFSSREIPLNKIIRGEFPGSIDDIALPARHLVHLPAYRRRSFVLDCEPVDFITSSRGCPFTCRFCSSKSYWNRRYFKRNPALVVDEIELLIETYDSVGIYFREDNFAVDKKQVLAICNEIINRKLKIDWECESRVDTISKDVLAKMKQAGCKAIWCGIESGSQKILDNIKKGYTLKQVTDFVEWCHELGIDVGACFMLGFPNETADDIKKTYDFAAELPVKWANFSTYVGFPKSELYEDYLKTSLWESRWEDVLITRNESFTTAQLYQLEKVMNRDLAKIKQKTGVTARRDLLLYYLKVFFSLFIHPGKFPGKLKNLYYKITKIRTNDLPFDKLLLKFAAEENDSNP